ncbi:MAG: DNA polymerase III subunit beta [Sulfuricaulis sp.]
MHFSTTRDNLLKPVSRVIGVVARGTDLFDKPILGNVLVRLSPNGQLTVTATDMQTQMAATMPVEGDFEAGQVTLPGRKLVDILRNLPEAAQLKFTVANERLPATGAPSPERAVLTTTGGRYILATLPAGDYPNIRGEATEPTIQVDVDARKLAAMMAVCAPAMASNDVRIYLNAMLLDLRAGQVNCVASDGHRLTFTKLKEQASTHAKQVLIGRKAAQELRTILDGGDGLVRVEVGSKLLNVRLGDVEYATLLVEQKFPEYEKMLPIGARTSIRVARQPLIDAVERADILIDNQHRAVALSVSPNQIRVESANKQQENSQEVVEADTRIDALRIGVNAGYLMDALRATTTPEVLLHLSDATTSMIVTESPDAQNQAHIIMPVRM